MPFNATDVFLPIVRFAGHSAAAAVGFVCLIGVTLIPVFVLKLILSFGPGELADLFDWKLLEKGILYIDVALYVITVVFWAFVFIVEEFRAVRRALGW